MMNEYVAENQNSEGLVFENFEAQIPSNSGMTDLKLS